MWMCIYTHLHAHKHTSRSADTRHWHSSCECGHQLWLSQDIWDLPPQNRSLRSFRSPGACNQPHHTWGPFQSIHNRERTEHWDQTRSQSHRQESVCGGVPGGGGAASLLLLPHRELNGSESAWKVHASLFPSPPGFFTSLPLSSLIIIIIITSVYCLFNLIIIALWTSSWSPAVYIAIILFFVLSGHELLVIRVRDIRCVCVHVVVFMAAWSLAMHDSMLCVTVESLLLLLYCLFTSSL